MDSTSGTFSRRRGYEESGWFRWLSFQLNHTLPSGLNLGGKLNIGFGVLVFMALLVVGLSFMAGYAVTQKIDLAASVRLPATVASSRAETNLLRMQSSLRGYLVLGDQQDTVAFHDYRQKFEANLAELRALSTNWTNADDRQQIEELEALYREWSSLPDQLFALHDNPLKNRPAVFIARMQVQPLKVAMLGDIDILINVQKQRLSSPVSREILADLADFETTFDAMTGNLIAYAASGEMSFKLSYGPYLTANAAVWRRLQANRRQMTRQQQTILSGIASRRLELAEASEKIISIVVSQHAYEDLYLYRTKVAPMAERMQQLLDSAAMAQQTQLQADQGDARNSLIRARLQTLAGGGVAALLGVVLAMLFRHQIVGPVRRLTQTAEQITNGNLHARAIVESHDEIGSLAHSMNLMTTRLSSTIDDLEQQSLQLETMVEISRQLASILDSQDLLRQVAKLTKQSFGYISVQILLMDEHQHTLSVAETIDDEPRAEESARPHPISPLARQAGLEGRPILRCADQTNYRSEMAVPIMIEQRIAGVINVHADRPLGHRDANLVQTLAHQVAVALTNARLFQQTQRAMVAAEIANQAKSEFLANMSHELRTPLNGILGYAQILKREADLTPHQKKGLTIIQQSGEHLLQLINDILDLAKIEAGRIDILPSPLYIPGFLENIANVIRPRADQKSLAFTCEQDHSLPLTILADEKRLRQVLINLLGNAVKFTDQGQVSLQVKLITTNIDGACVLRFEVKDTGIGISPDQLGHLFQPFEQVGEQRRRAEGAGLGLSISHQLVHAMGSEIQVDSQSGVGSRFWFDLSTVSIDTSLPTQHEPLAGVTRYLGAAKRILVVDDNDDNRKVMKDMLAPLGFDIRTVPSGEAALALVEQWQPDAILMDLIMPGGMNGHDATRQLRRNPALVDTVIIAASASAFEKDQAESLTAGCNAFISKPIHREHLLALLQHHLQLIWEMAPASDASPISNPTWIWPTTDELQQLQRMLRAGDLHGIRHWADRLSTHKPACESFAQKVHEMAMQFDEKGLQSLLSMAEGTVPS
ncbi:ATP-binding protein [Chitinivorax sp. B]|uniref:ATP-binding protein n=1 Tax=Chitinivorax sp. B TaxID=2502235 RepID=UPI00148503B4|nr:ATP-binding protein [Chitinivorax sp. B]